MTRIKTTIRIDPKTKQELQFLKGQRSYDELLLRMIKLYKELILNNKPTTPAKKKAMMQAIKNYVKNHVKFGENGRIEEIDLGG